MRHCYGNSKVTSLPRNFAPANAQIVHSGQACVVKEDNISEGIYTIREGDTLVLQCLVKGHPRPQVDLKFAPCLLLHEASEQTCHVF
ncbi:MAM domain-containing glycosylphosphatidylinositol anchor protein 1-like isoform X2 [Brachyhypopomus gauderio]|uniref:MAM domain-containing glycosylphosphatidylinositol anchor protein 1-like isoform X2 n=1 Tax=Brachyhypopomus gauderio TaxID=698409 RepID=UPI0040419B11